MKVMPIVLLSLLGGCVSGPQHIVESNVTAHIPNFVERLSLGLYVVDKLEGGIVIADIPQDMPLVMVLKSGDMITAINGIAINSRVELVHELEKYNEHDILLLDINRGNRIFKVKTELQRSMVRKDLDALFHVLAASGKVRLTIIVEKITNSFIEKDDVPAWQNVIKNELLASLENDYLAAFQNDPLFSLVDRDKVSKLLQEMHFELTGVVLPEETVKIGNFLGATHILFAQYDRLASAEKPFRDMQTLRLIEVPTGRVLASLSISKE